MTLAQLAAALAALLMVGLALFQAALALGAPLGRFAWGGAYERALPARLQVGSALMVPLLLAMATIVLIRAGLIYPELAPTMVWPNWAVFLFLVIQSSSNLRSASVAERRLMGPFGIALVVLVGFVAIRLG